MDRSKEVVHGPVNEGGPRTRCPYFVDSRFRQEKSFNENFVNKLTRIIQFPCSQIIFRVNYELPYKL